MYCAFHTENQQQILETDFVEIILKTSLVLSQSIRIQEPSSCVGFAVNGSTYIGITHSGPPFSPAANLSIFKMHKDLNITLVGVTLDMVTVFNMMFLYITANHLELRCVFCLRNLMALLFFRSKL